MVKVTNCIFSISVWLLSFFLTTAVHGGEFADNFKSGLSSSVLTLATADVHTLVGDQYTDANNNPINCGEGSIGHVLTHATVGCLSGELQGGSCDAGAAAGGVAAVLSGQIKGSGADYADAQEWTDEVRLAAGLGAALTGADNTDVQIAAGVGQSTFENNYLTHAQRARVEELIDELNQCRSTQNCSEETHEAKTTELRMLQELSTQQTVAMLNACLGGAAQDCATHVAASEGFEDWAHDSGYNRSGISVGFTPSMFQAGTAGGDFDVESNVNLDLVALDIARRVGSGEISAEQGAIELNAGLQRLDGGAKIVGGVAQTLSAGACLATKVTCVLGLLNGAVGLDRTYEGAVTSITGENQLSAIEAGLVAGGYTAQDAEALRDDIETGVAIVTVGVGGTYLVYKGGKAIAQVRQLDNVGQTAPNRTLSQSQIDEIVGAPNGQRPDPSTYMSQADIDNHLSLFDDGAVRLTPTSNVERFGNAGPDGGFLMPRSEFDRIVRETGGDLTQLENRLGLNTGDLTSGNVSALSIDRADLGNLRLPSGNEGGAINNPNWQPGGYTSGGVPEAVADISSAPFEDVTNLLIGR